MPNVCIVCGFVLFSGDFIIMVLNISFHFLLCVLGYVNDVYDK